MDKDVIGIASPSSLVFKHSNNNQVVIPEVIDVDKEEESDDDVTVVTIVGSEKKGKSIKNDFGDYELAQQKVFGNNPAGSSTSSSAGPQDAVISGDAGLEFPYDDDMDDYIEDYCDDFMDFDDDYALQTHFDNVDIPAGVEAEVTWFHDYVDNTKKTVKESSPLGATTPMHSGSSWSKNPAEINNLPSSGSNTDLPPYLDSATHNFGGEPSGPWWVPQSGKQKKKSDASSNDDSLAPGAYWKDPKKHLPKNPHGKVLNKPNGSFWNPNMNNQGYTSSSGPQFPNSSPVIYGLNHPLDAGTPKSSSFKPKDPLFNYDASSANFHHPFADTHMPPAEDTARIPKIVNEDDVLRKLVQFKQFDTVEDYSDHHYACFSGEKQPSKTWAKRIQEEWKILQDNLPDAIYVRVYETRMDLLRAVIVGAECTPYHDGLFFFDFFFPSSYPSVPPHVYYRSGGLRINPNLYNCGKVCLSLLGTWSGRANENWVSSVSTALQVLVSIQALILNREPFYNEPGYERMAGTPSGETQSKHYSENVFLLSLKTMVYTMRRPPKHFEDFVMGHFYRHANIILKACKAYADGAQVGCLVKGGVQDVDEGDKSSSQNFRNSLPGHVNALIAEFTLNGIKDCEKYRFEVKEQPLKIHGSLPLPPPPTAM